MPESTFRLLHRGIRGRPAFRAGKPGAARLLLTQGPMLYSCSSSALLCLLLLTRGCSGPAQRPLRYRAAGDSPQTIAVYEGWFGHPRHIFVGYSSHDPAVLREQIRHAKAMGISAFAVDWYGDREPFIDASYALMQDLAAKNDFKVAMMYDETEADDGATDEAIADFTMFRDTYLTAKAKGHEAYLTYDGRPVIFIFPKGKHTDWNKVRQVVNKWNPAPLLIYENAGGSYAGAFDGFYAWINPGDKGWAANGSNWGEQYLENFYATMKAKYSGKIVVGGAWAQFNDSKASWGLDRHISARCGQTFKDTFQFWRRYFPANEPIPFLMIETWNDYEEGSAIERGVPSCGSSSQPLSTVSLEARHSSAP
jgi:Glycosyl hydrolase family 71